MRWELEAFEKIIHEPADPARLKAMQDKLASMLSLTDTTINVVRRIASELRPSILDDLGLVEAIEWQTQQFQARTGIECRCDCSLQSIPLGDQTINGRVPHRPGSLDQYHSPRTSDSSGDLP